MSKQTAKNAKLPQRHKIKDTISKMIIALQS